MTRKRKFNGFFYCFVFVLLALSLRIYYIQLTETYDARVFITTEKTMLGIERESGSFYIFENENIRDIYNNGDIIRYDVKILEAEDEGLKIGMYSIIIKVLSIISILLAGVMLIKSFFK